jgi:UDP-2,3-diacylglucosamine hydrolase
VYLTHGDAYCTHDKMHQLLRWLTRPAIFRKLLLSIPYPIRAKMVHTVRAHSHNKKYNFNPLSLKYQINQSKLFKDMAQYHVFSTIYGHIHRPNHFITAFQHAIYNEYILSDWDDDVSIICYNKINGLYFHILNEKLNV